MRFIVFQLPNLNYYSNFNILNFPFTNLFTIYHFGEYLINIIINSISKNLTISYQGLFHDVLLNEKNYDHVRVGVISVPKLLLHTSINFSLFFFDNKSSWVNN